MTILSDILNKNKGVNSSLPVPAHNLDQEVPSTTKNRHVQESMQGEQSASLPKGKYPDKPQAINDDEYEYLRKRHTPDVISKAYAPFDPNSGRNIFEHYYQSTMSKPSALDEKKLKNKRIMAGVADGVSMLAQMFSAGSGAHVKERNDFALTKALAEEKEEKNKYSQLSQRYNDGLFQSRIKDFQVALDDYNNTKKSIENNLLAKERLDESQKRFEATQAQAKKNQENVDRDYELRKENQKSLNAQRRSSMVDSRNKAAAYVRKINSPDSGKNTYQMIFRANPNDPNARDDGQGNKVVLLNMSKGELDFHSREALADKDFMNSESGKSLITKHKGFVIGQYGRSREIEAQYKPNQDIAAAYIKYKYDKKYSSTHSQSKKQAPTGTVPQQPIPSWYNPDAIFNPDSPEYVGESEDENDGWDWFN